MDKDGVVPELSGQELRKQKLAEYLAMKGKLKPPNHKPYLRENFKMEKFSGTVKCTTSNRGKENRGMNPPRLRTCAENQTQNTALPLAGPNCTAGHTDTCATLRSRSSAPPRPRPSTTNPVKSLPSTTTQPGPCPSTPNPVRPRPSTTAPPRPLPSTSNPVRPRPSTSAPLRPRPSTSNPVRPRPSTVNQVRPRASSSNSVRPHPSTSNPVRPRPSTVNQVRPRPSTTAPPGTCPSTVNQVGPCASSSNQVRPRPSTTAPPGTCPSTVNQVGPRASSSNSVRPHPSTSNPVRPRPSTVNQVRPRPSTTAPPGTCPSTVNQVGPCASSSNSVRPRSSTTASPGPRPSTAKQVRPRPSTSAPPGPRLSTTNSVRPRPSTTALPRPRPSTTTICPKRSTLAGPHPTVPGPGGLFPINANVTAQTVVQGKSHFSKAVTSKLSKKPVLCVTKMQSKALPIPVEPVRHVKRAPQLRHNLHGAGVLTHMAIGSKVCSSQAGVAGLKGLNRVAEVEKRSKLVVSKYANTNGKVTDIVKYISQNISTKMHRNGPLAPPGNLAPSEEHTRSGHCGSSGWIGKTASSTLGTPCPDRQAKPSCTAMALKTPGAESRIDPGDSGTAPLHGQRKSMAAQEERLRKLQEWREAKGISYKRPPMPTRRRVKKPAVPQHFWAAMEAEDEAHSLVCSIDRSLADCIKLLQEGCPSEQVTAVLSRVPMAQKFTKYWICQARLMERAGNFEVLPMFEEALRAVLEPVDDLRTVVFEILKKKEKMEDEHLPATEPEREGGGTQEMLGTDHVTPKTTSVLISGNKDGSSVVKYKITATPGGLRSQQQGRMRVDGQELLFFTPVRRSVRIERSAPQYPAALQEHDPCVASLRDLLNEEEGQSPLYIYRENQNLHHHVHVQLL